MAARIALVTDFGGSGPYTGQLHLLMHAQAPSIPVLDLIADLTPFRPDLAAYLLPGLVRDIPEDSLYLCVVDPGVGGSRRAVALQADGNWYVAPDNGLLALIARRANSIRCWNLDWRPPRMSASFHGRDLFAPLAARIALGGKVPGSPMEPSELVGVDWPGHMSRVIYRDGYGNLCTGLGAAGIAPERRLLAGGRSLANARTFSNVPKGTPFWFENSFGLVELAVNCGRADQVLDLGPGDPVLVEST